MASLEQAKNAAVVIVQPNDKRFDIRDPQRDSDKQQYKKIISFEMPEGTAVGFSYNGFAKYSNSAEKQGVKCNNFYLCDGQNYSNVYGMYHIWKSTKAGKDHYTIASTNAFDGNIGINLPQDNGQRKLFVISTREAEKGQIAENQGSKTKSEEQAKLPPKGEVSTPDYVKNLPADDETREYYRHQEIYLAEKKLKDAKELRQQHVAKTASAREDFNKLLEGYLDKNKFNGIDVYSDMNHSKQELKDVAAILNQKNIFNNTKALETALVKLHIFKLQRGTLLTEKASEKLDTVLANLEDVSVYQRKQGNAQYLTSKEVRTELGNGWYRLDNPNPMPEFNVSFPFDRYGMSYRQHQNEENNKLIAALKRANSKEGWRQFASELEGLITDNCKIKYS